MNSNSFCLFKFFLQKLILNISTKIAMICQLSICFCCCVVTEVSDSMVRVLIKEVEQSIGIDEMG